jgi:hypothetical protein
VRSAETTIDLAIPNPQLNAVFVDDLFTTVVKVLLIPFVFAFLGIAVVISAIQSFFYNAAVIEAGKTDDSRRVASMQTATGSQQTQTDTATFTKHVTDRADADESSTVLTAASSSEPPANAPTSDPAKPAGRLATPRPVKRGSTELRQQLTDLSRNSDNAHSTAGTADAGDKGTTAGSSTNAPSAASSSSPDNSNSARGNSSGGDAGGS